MCESSQSWIPQHGRGSDIRQSKILHDTVERVLTTKCVSPHKVGFLNMDAVNRPLKFLGFVKAELDGNLVHSYHIKSFVLYSDSTTNECIYVHCLVTSRHLIACNTQESFTNHADDSISQHQSMEDCINNCVYQKSVWFWQMR
jgi:hypothetical protein